MMLPFTAASCINDDTICHKFTTISRNGWDTCSYASIYFDNNSQYKEGDFKMCIELRTNADFKFENLWIEISDNIEDSLNYTTDTLEIRITDKDGIRTGSNNAGLYTNSTFYRNYKSIRHQNNNVKIRHLMSCSPLTGITDIGIYISRQ